MSQSFVLLKSENNTTYTQEYPFISDLNLYNHSQIIAFFTDFIIKMGWNILDRYVAVGELEDYVIYENGEMYMMHDSG